MKPVIVSYIRKYIPIIIPPREGRSLDIDFMFTIVLYPTPVGSSIDINFDTTTS